jgi:hypothetical protein
MAKHSLVLESFPLRRGSRRGYNADVDDKPHSPDDDDDDDDEENECREVHPIIDNKQKGSNPTTAPDTTCRIQFYSHIKPKRRRYRCNDDGTSGQQQKHLPWSQSNKEKKKRHHYWTTTAAHPDIDLSLVPLLSSRELDQRTGGWGSAGAFAYFSTIPTTTTTCSSSSSSFSSSYLDWEKNGKSRTTFKDDDRGEKESFENTTASASSSLSDFFTKARPLAVVDYGSIELDMSGSLLDSFYKIVPTSTNAGGGEGRGNDGVVYTDWTGGRKRRRFSFAHSNYESIRSKKRRFDWRKRSLAGDEEVTKAACDNLSSSPLFPSLNQGSTNSILSIEPNPDDTSSCAVQVQAISATLVRSDHTAHKTTSSTNEGSYTTTETQTTASINREDFGVSSPPANITSTKMVEAGRIANVPTTLEAAISFSPFAR